MNILIDRDHRDQLHKVFHTDTNGNLLLPGDTIIGKESDFENRYKDEYSNKGPWVVENTEPSVIEINDNRYSIRHLDNNRAYQSNVPLNINGEKNWAIEAELKTIDQPISNQFGLVYGMNHTTGDKHLFYIDCNHQTMDIVSIDSGKVIWHLDRRRTLSIQKDCNIMRVECIDQFWYYYINSYLVFCQPSLKLQGNYFGYAMDGAVHFESNYFKINW